MNAVVDKFNPRRDELLSFLSALKPKLSLGGPESLEVEPFFTCRSPAEVVDLLGDIVSVQKDGHEADLEMTGVILEFDLEFMSSEVNLVLKYYSKSKPGSISVVVSCRNSNSGIYYLVGDNELLKYE